MPYQSSSNGGRRAKKPYDEFSLFSDFKNFKNPWVNENGNVSSPEQEPEPGYGAFVSGPMDFLKHQSVKAFNSALAQVADMVQQASQKKPEKPPVDPITAYSDQLAQLVGNMPPIDYEESLRASNQDIRNSYQHSIQALRAAMGSAKGQTAADRKDVMAMYRALSQDYARGAKNEVSQGQRVAQAMQNVANQAQGQISKSANQQLAEQAALAKNLGVEAAMPTVAAAQRNNLLKTVNSIQGRGQRAANDTLTYSGNQQRYLDRGGHNALLEGTNRSADLLADLQDYLQNTGGQIAGLQSDRDRALAANRTSVLSTANEENQKRSDDIFNQLLAIGKFKFGAENDRANLQLAAQKAAAANQPEPEDPNAAYPQFSQDYANILSQLGPGLAEKVKGILDPVVNGAQFRQGRYKASNTDEMIDLNPIAAGQLAVNAAKQQGIQDSHVLEVIRQAAMAYAKGS